MPAAESPPVSTIWKAAWALVGVPVAIVFGIGLAWHLLPTTHPFRDLTQDWVSIRCYRDGQSIYSHLAESLPRYFQGDVSAMRLIKVNAHPPVSVLALLPLGYLPHDQAMVAWNVGSLLLLPLALWLVLGPWGLRADPTYFLAGCCLAICSAPLASQVIRAQYNLVLLLLLTLGWLFDRRDHAPAAGIAIGLAASLKLFPGFVLLYFLFARRWQALAWSLATILGMHLAAGLVFGTADVWHYFREVIQDVDQWRSSWLNVSLAGFWSRLFNTTDEATVELIHWPALASGLTLACSAVVAAAIGWKALRTQQLAQRDVVFSATIIGMLLVSPIAWDHYLVLLILPVAVLWVSWQHSTMRRLSLGGLVALLTLVGPYRVWRLFLPDPARPLGLAIAEPWDSVTVLGLWTYGLIGLLALALGSTGKEDELVVR